MSDPAELLRDFVNTYDVEDDADKLASPAELASWLHARGLIAADDRATEDDLAAAVLLREGLRAALRRNHHRAAAARGRPEPAPAPADGPAPLSTATLAARLLPPHGPLPGDPPASPAPSPAEICTGTRRRARPPGAPANDLNALLASLPLRVTLDGPTPAVTPVAGGVRGGLARLAAAVIDAHAAGVWPRLKVCVEDTCQWAFIDSSKNRSRSWCSMKVCGNRTKTRAYRARHRGTALARRA